MTSGRWRNGRLEPGVYVMSITPFDANGRLDEGALREHFRRMIAAGIGVLPASTGTGEGPLMTDEEIWRTWEIAVEESDGTLPVIAANREFPTAAQNVRHAREALARGLDAIQIYPATLGHSSVPTPRMLEFFYDEIVAQIELPILVSSNMTTGFEVPVEIHERLLDRADNVIGFYKNHSDIRNVAAFMNRVGGRTTVLISGASLWTGYAWAGAGQLDNVQNIAPRLCKSFHEAYTTGDQQTALDLYIRILDTVDTLTAVARRAGTSKLAVYKAALGLLGLPGGYPRKPYLAVQGDALDDLARTLDGLGLADTEGLR